MWRKMIHWDISTYIFRKAPPVKNIIPVLAKTPNKNIILVQKNRQRNIPLF